MSRSEQLERLRQLLQQQRWASLATLGREGWPEGSMVAYVFDTVSGEAYLHLSELAAHTRNLQQYPQASLVISECDDGTGDPQQLARASLSGNIRRVEPEEPVYEQARRHYLSRLPDAEPLFSFADFHLFRFCTESIRFVGGFAQAYSIKPGELAGGSRR